MKKIATFITGNKTKWDIAKSIFEQYEIELLQEKIDTPEIQDLDVENVANYSAKYACDLFQKSVIKNDVGYYIPSLNGFPGPFTKFANQWFNADQILKLMDGKKDRTLIIKDCLSYCAPDQEPVTFNYECHCTISTKSEGSGGTFDTIIIRDGQDKIQSLYTPEEMLVYWSNNLKHYHDLARYIRTT
jgi:XTP/dITP diphosphohydrolase